MTNETLILTAHRRDAKNKSSRLRNAGRVPAVLYGHGISNQMLWIEGRDIEKIAQKAGSNTVVTLSIENETETNKEKFSVLLYDFQRDPLKNMISHVDFLNVRMDEVIDADIPLVFVGESAAVKAGGTLVHATSSVEVRSLPNDLPHEITIDISTLKTFDDSISVKDIVLPSGVTVLADLDTVIAVVTPPRSDAEMEALNTAVDADVTKVEGVADKPKVEQEVKGKK